ncbi:outer membrane beta-barrel protein [Bradyrhizobium sp. S69]|uniref:outer membrane beta-barrel protein n=1 Tax=Bradyrhizobium sp. S69 TaxID=1641856 RepID=UPI00131C7C7E|nr:outer membrane beta-barrel protein [Bradyrhizobium sp. S69]
MSGPATGRRKRASSLRASLPCLTLTRLTLSCLALIAFDQTLAQAQSITPDLFRPVQGGFVSPQDLPLRKTAAGGDPNANTDDDQLRDPDNKPAPSRIGQIPQYGLPPASGASASGFDSLNRTLKKPKLYPGQAKTKPSPGPGTPPPSPPKLNAAGQLRLSIAPSESANKTPLPPAMAGTVDGQPSRRRLKVDDDPFGPVGDYAGGFLIKSAVEVSGGYETNPGRLPEPKGAPFWVVAPEFLAQSDWERHALVADLRGSFTGYGNSLPPIVDGAISPSPTDVSRPSFTGHVDGRLDVTQDTHILSEVRLLLSTDNPGSPNIQTGLARYPIYTTLGGTFGVDQNFNRLNIYAGGTVDRTVYQNSTLTDGTTATNDDRNFNQYGGITRASYELTPAVKPFVEVEGDSRVHDLALDRNGFARDSTGGYAKGGTSFEFSRLLTGEIAVGYEARDYADSRLGRLEGLLTTASLTWTATPLTTAKFYSDTQIGETTLPGTSGVLVHTYTVEADHDFRRWLTAIGKFTFGTYDYQGDGRSDKTYSVEGDLIYKMTRNLWIKGSVRRDILNSNIAGASSASTIMMLGVRVQN